MSKLHPDAEALFDHAEQTLLCLTASDFISIEKSELYNDLNAEMMNLRDKYRLLAEKKVSAPSAGTPGADKDSSKNPIFSVEEFKKNVKPQITLTYYDEGVLVDGRNISKSSQYAHFIDSLVFGAIDSGCDLAEVIKGLIMAAAHIKIPIYKQALITALMAERDGHI